MRQDQYEKLQQLEEKLLDVFLTEADPATWPGQGIPLGSMEAKTRGDLYWVRKTAASVLVLATKVAATIGNAQEAGGGTTPGVPGDGEPDTAASQLDADLASAEKEAGRLMRELQQGGQGKKAFDRKVHGA